MEEEKEEQTQEISPQTIQEIKKEEERPKTLAELVKEIMKQQQGKKKQILYDEFLPAK